ncbi:hypothetical protein P4O66_015202, partial [Electrophorus voltai]
DMGMERVIPGRRGRCPAVCAVLVSVLALVGVWLLDPTVFREMGGLCALSLSLGPALYSLCLLMEECLFHSHQRYGGKIQRMLQACCSTATLAGVLMVVATLLVRGSAYTLGQWATVGLTCAIYLLFKALGVLGPSAVEISEVCESRNLNVAHGLAWSFYLGYLKLVLPELQELVSKDYNLTRDKLISSRLHILLPMNAVVTARLEEEDHNVRFHRNLPELRLDRAGVRGRVYKHSVYKITDQNQKEYCCVVEYATPLLTLYQMSQDDTAGLGETERRQQVLLFYRALSHILENSLECRNRYCLVLLDDKHAGDSHYLSKELTRCVLQERQEVPMELPPRLVLAMEEEGGKATPVQPQLAGPQGGPHSSLPSLMISGPRTLRSEPGENTDYPQNHHPRCT